MAISPPPKKKNEFLKTDQTQENNIVEKKITDFISRGGSTAGNEKNEVDEEKLKGINIKLLPIEIKTIKALREKRPRLSRSGQKRLAISLHDWIVEAIQEKMEKEKKKYNLIS